MEDKVTGSKIERRDRLFVLFSEMARFRISSSLWRAVKTKKTERFHWPNDRRIVDARVRDSERENGPNWRTLSAKTSRSSSICCSYLVVRLGRVYRQCRVFVTNQSKWPSFAAPVPIDNGL